LNKRKIRKMSPLHNDEKRSLLQIARTSIESVLVHRNPSQIPPATGNLARPHGAFVTLHCRGRLRGCIGRVASVDPVAAVVADCAVAAATGDPRFPRLKPSDLHDLEIEVSVLSRPERVGSEEVQPGVHGLVISQGERRGVLLPQVAIRYRWSRENFLQETCLKAGLDPEAWRSPGTSIEIFTAEVFSEVDCALPDDASSDASATPYSSSQ
jgi:AmmeMemoRadiSam system protein A